MSAWNSLAVVIYEKICFCAFCGPGHSVCVLCGGAGHDRRLSARAIAAPAIRVGGRSSSRSRRPGSATTHRFYYRRSLANGFEFVIVDADTQQKQPSFDHTRLADALSRASGRAYSATRLPFQNFTFNDALSAIEMTIDGARWTCTLADYACRTPDVPPPGEIRRGISGPVRGDISAASPRPRMSPDGKWMAFIDNYNVAIRPFGGDKRMALSTDGSEGNYYDGASIAWSPDSSKLVAYRIRPAIAASCTTWRRLRRISCSREHWAMQYAKPGDLLDLEQPVLFDVRSQKQIIDRLAAVPESLRHVRPGVAQGQPRLQLRIQPARPPGVPGHRSRRADRRRARRDLRRAEDIFLLQPLAPRRCRPASAIATTSPTARKWSGCRSATAGTISI